jgi:hypothetical protein
MATNTSILGLSKPAYTDDADVAVINSNSDLIDAEAGRTRANFAAEYSNSSAYAVGAFCTHAGILYQCNTAIGSGGEAWTAAHWTQISAAAAINANTQAIATLNSKIAKQTVTTGVTNVYAVKNDLLALVWFIDKSIPSVSSNGWQTLFTLPSGCRPSADTEFTMCVSASSAEALEGRVKTTGEVNVYAFTSVSGKPVCGQVMFFI